MQNADSITKTLTMTLEIRDELAREIVTAWRKRAHSYLGIDVATIAADACIKFMLKP